MRIDNIKIAQFQNATSAPLRFTTKGGRWLAGRNHPKMAEIQMKFASIFQLGSDWSYKDGVLWQHPPYPLLPIDT